MMRKLLAGGVVIGVGAVLFGVAALGRSSDANAVGPFPTVGTGPKIVVSAPSLVNPTTVQFTVSTAAGANPADPMTGWQLGLRWDPAVFSFASAVSQPAPGVSGSAAPTLFPGAGAATLAAFSLSGPYTTLGLMTTVQLTVVAPGCSAIHLFTYGPPDNGDQSTASFTTASDYMSVEANQGYVDGTANNLGSTCTPTPPATPTSVATATNTPAPTATNTSVPTATNTAAPTATNTATPTAVNTATPAATDTPAPTATNTSVPTATNTAAPTATNTPVTPTNTPVATDTPAPTATFTATATATNTATATATSTATATATNTATATATNTATATATNTVAPTATNTPQPTSTPCGEGGCPTPTPTRVVIIVSTATFTSTAVPPTAAPAAPTSTGTAVSTVLAAQATQAPPTGGAGAGVRAPNTGNAGVPDGSAQGRWWFAAGMMALGALGLSGLSLGLRRRRR